MSTVLITGAASGFGRLMTETLSGSGHHVAASLRDADGRNASARVDLEAIEGVEVVELDVSDDASVARGVAEAEERTGGLDVVVNNAGVGLAGLVETVTPDQARAHFEVNVFGPMRVNRAVLPFMRERGAGLLVHVSSGLGRMIFPFVGVYAAGKFALEALAEAYRYELAPVGVDSVIVEPGAYATPFMDNGTFGEDADRARAYGPLADGVEKLFGGDNAPSGSPQEVADAVRTLVETPFGERPLRTPVGDDVQGLHQLNDATDGMQRQVLEAMGFGELASGPAAA